VGVVVTERRKKTSKRLQYPGKKLRLEKGKGGKWVGKCNRTIWAGRRGRYWGKGGDAGVLPEQEKETKWKREQKKCVIGKKGNSGQKAEIESSKHEI